MRFHMIDRIHTVCYGKSITAWKCISLSDDVFNEHFPGYPIFPGSLILEGLAQLSGSFFEMTMHEQQLPMRRAVLTVVRHLKLRKPAGPGDRLFYKAQILSMQDDFGVAKVSASIEDELYAEGELMFHFIHIDDPKIQQSREELYKIVTKNMKVLTDENQV